MIQFDHSHKHTSFTNMVTAAPANLCGEIHEDLMRKKKMFLPNMITIIIQSSQIAVRGNEIMILMFNSALILFIQSTD